MYQLISRLREETEWEVAGPPCSEGQVRLAMNEMRNFCVIGHGVKVEEGKENDAPVFITRLVDTNEVLFMSFRKVTNVEPT